LVAVGLFAAGVACSEKTVDPAGSSETLSASSTATGTGTTTSPANNTPSPTATGSVRLDTPLDVSALVQMAEPSIVRIATTSGVGTGFIVREDGYLVTNNHVVALRTGGTSQIVQVTLSDGTVTEGRVVSTDPRADIALVKI